MNDFTRRGFTLIEMLVTMVVLSILMGVSAPRLLISDGRRVGMEAEQLLRNLEMARTRSMARRSVVRVSFNDATTEPGYVAYQDIDADDNVLETTAERNAFAGFGAVDLGRFVAFGRGSASAFPGDTGSETITLPSKRVDFDRRGLTIPLGTRGIIYLHHTENPEVAAAITVSGSGSFRVWRYTDGEWR